MNKTIKIIDLLNKMLNGEEVPEKIKYGRYILKYDKSIQDYMEVLKTGGGSFINYLFANYQTPSFINNEVEIIEDKEIGQENNRESKVKQTSDEFKNETRYYTPEGEIYKTIIETYKCPKNYISKDKIKEKIEKYKCFKWKCKDDEYWANRILDVLQELLEERN